MAQIAFITNRLESISELKQKYTICDSIQAQKVCTDIQTKFFSDQEAIKPHLQPLTQKKDISEVTSDEVKGYLMSLGIRDDEKIWLIWIPLRAGISILFRDFVEYYDDLWYPSSDDVWLTDTLMSWLIEFDHEEVITFIQSL